MTDLEVYAAMLSRAGIAFSTDDMRFSSRLPEARTIISVDQSHWGVGYAEFGAMHVFDGAGVLIAVGGYE